MKKALADLLAAQDTGIEVRDDYSGRCMCGETTCAVVADSAEAIEWAFAEIMVDSDRDERLLAANGLRQIRKDEMGLGVVWY